MLAICVPVRNDVTTGFAYSLAQLTARLSTERQPFMLFFESGSILPDQRQRLVNSALAANCSEILWLDSDMVFPATIYQLLQRHQSPVVACAYSTRTQPYQSTAFTDQFDLSQRLASSTGLHPVYAVGMGCMLTDVSVFKTIPAPWFAFSYDYKTGSYQGEDLGFCKTLAEYGITVYVDVDASQECRHTGVVDLRLSNV